MRADAGSRGALIRGAAAALLAALPVPTAFAQPSGLPPPSAIERRTVGPSIRLEAIEIDGPALIGRDAIDDIARPYIGRMVTSAELRGIAAALAERIEAEGYTGSRVQLPDQELRDGKVALRVVPARLTAVNVSPATFWNRHVALSAWLLPRGEETLHMPTLQERLAMLRESGLVERVNAEVAPFDARGSVYIVNLAVEESVPLRVAASYANNRSPSIGARRAELALFHRSLVGLGDTLEARFGRTSGLDDSFVSYRLPIPRVPLALLASRTRSDSLAVDPPVFRELDITAVGDTDTLGADWTISRTATFSALLRYTHDRRESRTELLGIPFSFVPGVLDGVSTARVHRLAAEAVRRGTDWSASARLQWSRGETNSDTSLDELASDRDFDVAALSLGGLRELGGRRGQLRARLDAQYTRDRLFPFEKLAIGGAATVRGYRENVLLRDSGAIASIEWLAPEWRFWSDRLAVGGGAFVDAAWGRASRGSVDEGPSTLASIGLTLRVELWRRLTANVAWALPRHRHFTERRDLQDRGVHYWIGISYP